MYKAFMQPIMAVPGLEELRLGLKKNRGVVEISGCLDSEKAHMAAGITADFPVRLLVAENELKARELYEDMQLFDPEVLYYPRRDLIFYQADISGNLLTKQRMQVIKALIEQEHVSIVTSTGGCMDYLLPLRVLKEQVIRLEAGTGMDLTELTGKLSRMGYERCVMVNASGQFAVRGDIVDIFPLTEEVPWRIEFFGDEIDLIKSFDPESQRMIENLDAIAIYPATEDLGYTEEQAAEGNKAAEKSNREFYRMLHDTLLDYLPEGSPVVVDDPARVLEQAEAIFREYKEAMVHRLEKGKIHAAATKRMITDAVLARNLELANTICLTLMEHRLDLEIRETHSVSCRSVNSYNNQFPLLLQDLAKWKRQKYRVILASPSRTRGKRLAEELQREELNVFYSEDTERELQPGEIMVIHGTVRRGFEYPMQKFVVITEADIFGAQQKKKKKHRLKEDAGERIRNFTELSIGDYVVHENHGMGIYRGIEKIEMDHVKKDYIKIEYAGGSSLYILATQMDALQKYGGSDGHKPKINTLGSKDWTKTKTRVRSAVKDIAADLVRLYAARNGAKGYQYDRDTVWQREFEELFPFEETEDQLKAIEDTKRDMESSRVMDRLICGDVGFGKTEIAIRAAFKAVQESKQVVLLCPTTILAQQHFNTFSQRMDGYPVRVDMLSRFRNAAQQKKTVADVEKGKVDILIGTHRVLSKDIKFKDLGLLIIDEEQRFGVAHKEKIKQMKENIDVLTLTATPIPRTLHMSMIGIRDMSVLEEPPLERMPIQTYVMEYDDEMVREAISRELAREGQVFFVYNRVKGIDEMAARVQKLVPEANVAYAHGQMNERQLEKIMVSFINGEIDVLVSTTIIETGIDISNANTLIICDAERLGLSQLYQLRGRVGRSNRNAYAFLLYTRNKMLKETAEKRLHAIREFTEMGSGVKIAMRDLEIRGAGNLLGAEQSGHMEAVGYDLYCKMLAEAVQEAQGIRPAAEFETTVDLTVNAFIPPTYIQEENQRLDIYKRVAAIETEADAVDMEEELLDRFGMFPDSVKNLITIAQLKADAHKVFVSEIKQQTQEIRISLFERAELNPAHIPDLLNMDKYRNILFFYASGTPHFKFLLKKPSDRNPKNVLMRMKELMEDMQALLTGKV
ncbi:MAG: transcription-repair coupling factor [Eubacteriales bacterium]|nr:transcription-repair coupling factor [Eubacteriales bacterium]